MRRLRAWFRSHALGRRRGSARLATTGCLPGAWLTVVVKRPPKSAARRRKENAAMARREAPAFSRGNAAHKEQWLRHLARHLPRTWRGKRKKAPLRWGKRRRTRRRKETGRRSVG